MQVFLSHSSKQKPLVREIMRTLPDYLEAWIDENRLLFGEDVPTSLETVIKSDTDYVLIFIDEYAVASSWVAKEIQWTLEAERTHGRIILLPIVIDEAAFATLGDAAIRERKYLVLRDYTEDSIRSLGEAITSALFALVCRDMDTLRHPKPKALSKTISEAEALVHDKAAIIHKAVFPHRKSNPITLQALLQVVNSQSTDQLSGDEFEPLLSTIVRQNLVPGLYYDGVELYLVEEHALWKSEVRHDQKARIGKVVGGRIPNGAKVILDAGSTTGEIAAVICRRIENRALVTITIATPSIHIANMISDCCVKMGFDDAFSSVRLFVPGGQVRPGTQAVVAADATRHELLELSEIVGGFDLSVVGVNGVDIVCGFTTHDNREAANKRDMMQAAREAVLVGDSSKIGICLEAKIADFADELEFVVDSDSDNEKLTALMGLYGQRITLA